MRYLYFLDPVQEEGAVNVTVRRGRKWSEVPISEVVTIRKTDFQEDLYSAEVIGYAVMRCFELPEAFLDLEHDPSAREPEGLLSSMKRAYPDFDVTEEVTVLFYIPKVL